MSDTIIETTSGGVRVIRLNRPERMNSLGGTLLGLVGEEHLSSRWVKRAKDFRYGPSHVLGTPMFCLYEAPDYRSARWDADINRCFYTVVGYEGQDDMARYIRDAYSGTLPKPAAGTWVNSLWDPSQAPPGRHAATGLEAQLALQQQRQEKIVDRGVPRFAGPAQRAE